MQDFTKLLAWQKAHRVCLEIHRATALFPRDHRFGLSSQLRRAAMSVPANLAEGCGRTGRKEMARFAEIAIGSAYEAEYYLLLSRDLELLALDRYQELTAGVIEVKRMLVGLTTVLRRHIT